MLSTRIQRMCGDGSQRRHVGKARRLSIRIGRDPLVKVGRTALACLVVTSTFSSVMALEIGVGPASASGEGWVGLPFNLPLPSGSTTVNPQGVSCTSNTACIAVGIVSSQVPVVESFAGSTWIATNLPLPSGQTSTNLTGISCTSATACVAIGWANDSSGYYVPVAESLAGTTWTATNLPLPSGQLMAQLTGISCTAATVCVAAGSAYSYTSGDWNPVAETLSGSTWTATNLPLPAGQTYTSLSGVSCSSSTACVAAGQAYASGLYEPVVETLSGTTWSAINLPIPSGYSNARLRGISCTSGTVCVAVGSSQGSSGPFPIAESLSGTTWTASVLPLGSNCSGPLTV